jgi:hypothetical protein
VLGIQFHLETTAALVRALAAHCPDDLAPGTFVQPENELRSAGAAEFQRLNRLMRETLDGLCSSVTPSLDAGQEERRRRTGQ